MIRTFENSMGLKLILSFVLIFSVLSSFNFAEASDSETSDESMVYFEKVNDSIMKLNIENGEGYIDENGNARIKDNVTGTIADLPAESVDKNGAPVNLVYKKDGNDLLVEYHSQIQPFGVAECALGTVGSTGSGALAGMGIGAMGATPVTVLGGGVFGGAFSGMTGAATFCF
ncbi:hypothetical protein [Salinicoccus albus]|uniref:hypothetical protein n=1 Tax=Salinicoccus albus TaxID=418756 RepID=UPI00036C28FB|nr:hypothetical protein [Salinicoccus albus]